MRIVPAITASKHWWSSAATRASGRRAASSTPGNCASRFAGGCPISRSDRAHAEFYLTQIVSHHSRGAVESFLAEAGRRGLTLPGMFGVFYYRSANPRTLAALKDFLPVPVEELTREFNSGATADEICARSIRALIDAGARHFYVSNLPLGRAATTLNRILAAVAG